MSKNVPSVFVSYRRADTQHPTDRLVERLQDEFGAGQVFQDVGNIPYGANFRTVITEEIDKRDIVLIMIGPQWGKLTNERASDPNDSARIEVEQALTMGKLVIPVLVDNTKMPDPNLLPQHIRDMCGLNAAHLRPNPDFNEDADRLISQIRDWYRQRVGSGTLPKRPSGTNLAPSSVVPPPSRPKWGFWRWIGLIPFGGSGAALALTWDPDNVGLAVAYAAVLILLYTNIILPIFNRWQRRESAAGRWRIGLVLFAAAGAGFWGIGFAFLLQEYSNFWGLAAQNGILVGGVYIIFTVLLNIAARLSARRQHKPAPSSHVVLQQRAQQLSTPPVSPPAQLNLTPPPSAPVVKPSAPVNTPPPNPQSSASSSTPRPAINKNFAPLSDDEL